jgi:hypothetical protein
VTAAVVGLQASWVGGGLACSILVFAALFVRSFRTYDARTVLAPAEADTLASPQGETLPSPSPSP